MQITQGQYHRIKPVLPVQRGNVCIDNFTFLNAIFYIAENGCKWRTAIKFHLSGGEKHDATEGAVGLR
jgi:transposase